MSHKTIGDVKLYELDSFTEVDGTLVAIEELKQIPFEIKRIFYVFGANDSRRRGKHAHYVTQQVLICLRGDVVVTCRDGSQDCTYILNSPTQALYVPQMVWDEQVYTSEDTILLVLSNTLYDKSDYIEDYSEFKKLKGILE